MHTVISKKDIILTDQYFLYKGNKYLMDDCNVGLFINDADNDATIQRWENEKSFDSSKDWNSKSILIIRAGGYGDNIFLTPVVREIKKRWADCMISISTRPSYMAVWENNDSIESCLEYPVRVEDAERFDAIVGLEYLLENAASKHRNCVDLILERMGLTTDNKTFELKLRQDELDWAKKDYPRNGKRRVAIQGSCTSDIRSYPAPLLSVITETLARNNIEVFLVGEPRAITSKADPNLAQNIINLSEKCHTYRESLAISLGCDLYLGVDSGLTYGVSAVGTPCIAIYGSYPAKFRSKYQKNIKVLENCAPCAPCFSRHSFPYNSPCSQSKRCEVIASVHPQVVLNVIMEALK